MKFILAVLFATTLVIKTTSAFESPKTTAEAAPFPQFPNKAPPPAHSISRSPASGGGLQVSPIQAVDAHSNDGARMSVGKLHDPDNRITCYFIYEKYSRTSAAPSLQCLKD